MLWICIAFMIGLFIGCMSMMNVLGVHGDTLCPLNKHWQLVQWAQGYYPNIVASWFQKQNKTYLISLWYTRPDLEWPSKKYKKGE